MKALIYMVVCAFCVHGELMIKTCSYYEMWQETPIICNAKVLYGNRDMAQNELRKLYTFYSCDYIMYVAPGNCTTTVWSVVHYFRLISLLVISYKYIKV